MPLGRGDARASSRALRRTGVRGRARATGSRRSRRRRIRSHAPRASCPPRQERYAAIAREVQAGARRMVICGMHVHVGLDDDELRIDVMNQLSYFVPHLLALSCSSPFWEGDDMGMQSFRLMLFSRCRAPACRSASRATASSAGISTRWCATASSRTPPRSGGTSARARAIRRSRRASSTAARSLDDAVCLAALIVSLVRMLYRLRRDNKSWRRYPHMLIAENRWRAMRFASTRACSISRAASWCRLRELLEELIALVREDAEALCCLREVEYIRTILTSGTSAHRQIRAVRRCARRGRQRSRGAAGSCGFFGAGDRARSCGLIFRTPRSDACVAPLWASSAPSLARTPRQQGI